VRIPEAFRQPRGDRNRAPRHVLTGDHVERSERSGTSDRMAEERLRVDGLAGRRAPGVHRRARAEARRQRKTAPERLPRAQEIRHCVAVRPQRTGPTEAGEDLVARE
jgi:hypothetical protein